MKKYIFIVIIIQFSCMSKYSSPIITSDEYDRSFLEGNLDKTWRFLSKENKERYNDILLNNDSELESIFVDSILKTQNCFSLDELHGKDVFKFIYEKVLSHQNINNEVYPKFFRMSSDTCHLYAKFKDDNLEEIGKLVKEKRKWKIASPIDNDDIESVLQFVIIDYSLNDNKPFYFCN